VVWLAGTLGVLTPRLTTVQMRALVRLGVILRWVAVAFAGLAGLLGPRVPNLLAEEILAAVIYNGLVMGAAYRATDEALPTVALATTVIDQLFCFTFIGLYNVTPGSHQVAAYVPGLIEAVAFFGVAGAVLSTGIFLAGVLVAQVTGTVLGRGTFDSVGVFGATMIVILIAACLAAVSQVLGRPVDTGVPNRAAVPGPTPPPRPALSGRQHDVLQLLAQGSSNAMIASRLGVSERMVKASVERLLTQLKARNRAEAVATAIRYELL
jgi:DNA-binding CsgD family transcriptional regulator